MSVVASAQRISETKKQAYIVKVVFLAAILCALFSNACTDLRKDQSKRQESPCAARYVPVDNNSEIALDTPTGTLCRTIAGHK
jgi:hypothetical protein